MRLLLLGGTRFVGYHLATEARRRGHAVTLFHRGRHGVAFPDAETILGDRNQDLSALRGREWDAVIDTSGYLPQSVKAAAEALRTGRYIFISSISAHGAAPLTADQLQQAGAIDTSGDVYASTFGNLYGGLKILCEQAAEDALPGRVLTIRPGVIVGPLDYTDRLTYWVLRVARGGEVLAPGSPDRPVRFIDVRDLSEWTLAMVEQRNTGTFNAAGAPMAMATLLETCRQVSGSDARFTWADDRFLVDHQVVPWTEMPLWLPHRPAFMDVSTAEAIAAGLRYRPLAETVRDILAAPPGRPLRAGLSDERERELLGSRPSGTSG